VNFGRQGARFVEHAVGQLVGAQRYNPEVAGSIPDGVIGIFH